jgi:hypothetical protein
MRRAACSIWPICRKRSNETNHAPGARMLSHLTFLTRHIEGTRPEAQALAVYAEPMGTGFRPVPADGWDHEGVACVDDAARAVVLYCKLWRDHRCPWLRPAIAGLLNFVRGLQRDDGAFANFILDWTGSPNLTSPTSRPGGPWWTARAMRALAYSLQSFDSEDVRRAFLLGRPWMHQYQSISALAVAIDAELDYWQVTQDPLAAHFCLNAAEEIAGRRDGRVLADDSAQPRFWGHHQERALIRVALAFDRPPLAEIAVRSAFELFGPAIGVGFAARKQTVPYEVSCAAGAFDAVYRVAGDERARELADLARAWFHGRNAASSPVYDSVRQLAYDGVDGDCVSRNSGAEANLEAAFALYAVLPWDGLAGGRGAAFRGDRAPDQQPTQARPDI